MVIVLPACIVRRTMYVGSTIYIVRRTIYYVRRTLYYVLLTCIVRRTLYYDTLYTILCTLYTIQCILLLNEGFRAKSIDILHDCVLCKLVFLLIYQTIFSFARTNTWFTSCAETLRSTRSLS